MHRRAIVQAQAERLLHRRIRALGRCQRVTYELGRLILVGEHEGLVSLKSALGQYDDPQYELAFSSARQYVALGVNHLALLLSAAVGRQFVERLKAPPEVS